MRLSCPVLLPVVLAIVAAVAAPRVPAQSLPPDFVAEPIGSDWANPVGFAFVDAASALVAEKAGKLWYVLAGSKSLVLDLRSETLNKGDRGLLDVALDPQFAQNGFVYLLLAVDPNADGLDEEQSTFARLTRYTAAFADGSFTIDPASRVDLLGATWPGGVPSCYLSHTIGMLAFLADGSLVVGAGDGAHHELVDAGGNDPLCFGADRFPGDQDLGAFRAQYMASLAGKILRVDPKSGLGLADNPFFDGDPTSLASRIWALGLRNPFRFALQPGSGPHETLFVGDVGWDAWEEIDVVRGGENFGWPCSEGPVADASYRAADPQGFCARGAFAEPILAWNHSDPGQLGFTGRCTSGVCVYTSGSYPPLCHGGLFFCDLTAGWIKMALLDAYDRVLGVLPFATDAGLPITLRSDPFSGDLVYISLATNQILRLRYVGANQPPVAVVAAAPTVGRPPLLVQFSASSSYDPEGGPLAFLWSFGDGATSTDPDPLHVYTDAGAFTATIELTDVQGKTTAAEIPISTANTPPVITAIDAPLDGSFYQNGVPIELRATASDAEDDLDQKPLDAVWHVDLVEAHHTHPDWVTVTGLSGSFVPQADDDDGSHYLHLTLVVTDSDGASASRSLDIYDADTRPVAHLVALSDYSPRVAQVLNGTGHMEYPGKGQGELVWDWGDGTVERFSGYHHQEDVHPVHRYASAGAYDVTLTAQAGAASSSVVQSITVRSDRSAVAVFVPLVAERFIPWDEQQSIATSIVQAVQAEGFEASVFYYDDQVELEQWARGFLGDPVRDAIVILDLCPAVLYAGERDRSLAERWIESGDGIIWTGAQPFAEYVFADGTTSATDAGEHGADDVLDAALPGICTGSGWQQPTPLGARELPSLAAFDSDYALRTSQLGPGWRVDRLHALGNPGESDAVVITRGRGGFYAQLHCSSDPALPRAGVLIELLDAYLLHPGLRIPGGGADASPSASVPGR